MVYKHIWDFPWSKQDETADGSTWTWVEVQDREQHSAELPFSKGEGRTAAPRQQESVTTFRHSPRQETALDGTRSWKVKSKQLAISDFAKLGQDCRARYFLISHRNSRTISGKHDSVESLRTAKKMLQQFFFFSFSLSPWFSPSFLRISLRIVSIWSKHWQDPLCTFSFPSRGRAARTNFITHWWNNSGVCGLERTSEIWAPSKLIAKHLLLK